MDLKSQKCVPCEMGGLPLNQERIKILMAEIPEWELLEEDGVQKIKSDFKFPDFKEALYFVDRIGAAAEEEDHHPRLVLEWGKVGVWWWTHKVKGLHQNDFILAARTDEIYATNQG
jgi:4a-hydroxytetrahydrobiopterin dehydratase